MQHLAEAYTGRPMFICTMVATERLYIAMTTCPMVQASYTPRFGLYAIYTTEGRRPEVE